MRKTLFVVTMLALLSGCTAQERARSFGGTTTELLPKGQKLVVATWKENDLWFLLRPMRAEDTVETYTFKESASWGVLEGTVVLQEQR